MKVVKFLMKTILWIVAFVLVVILTIPLWISPVVCGVANKVAPGITKTDFHLGTFKLNPYTGHLVVGDLQLGNPTNFTEKNAVDLKQFEVKIAMTSLLGKKIRVELVDLGALQVYAAFPKADNFLQIAKNAQGEAKPEAKTSAEAEVGVPEKVTSKEKTDVKAESPTKEEKPAKGVQIDRLAIHDITIKYGMFPVPFGLTLTGIGADKDNGASLMDVFNEIKNEVMKTLSNAAGAVGDLGKAASKAANEAATKAVSQASDAAANAAGAVGDAAANATKAAGEAAGKALDSIKNLW